MSDRVRVIEICNNLIGTINKLSPTRRVPQFDKEMFNPPLVKRGQLVRKLKNYQLKYNIKNKELNKLFPLSVQ